MPQHSSQSAPGKDPKLPLLVVLVILYQLAKAGFFGWVFWLCWQAQGSGIPPFGDVEAHNPLFEAPLFFLLPLLGASQLIVGFGLLALGRWARTCSTLLLICAILGWFLEHVFGFSALQLPVNSSMILAAIAAELLAITILYGTAESRHAFAPATSKNRDEP